jgi:ribosome-binding factor A
MPKDYQRTERIAEVIRCELAQVIQQVLRDPRLGWITVVEAQVTKDLAYAKVYVSIIEEEQAPQSIKILNQAAGYLRTTLAQRVKLRTIPKLTFYHDDSLVKGNRLTQIIEQSMAEQQPSVDDNSDSTPDNV